jgi:hypothetical protein
MTSAAGRNTILIKSHALFAVQRSMVLDNWSDIKGWKVRVKLEGED